MQINTIAPLIIFQMYQVAISGVVNFFQLGGNVAGNLSPDKNFYTIHIYV